MKLYKFIGPFTPNVFPRGLQITRGSTRPASGYSGRPTPANLDLHRKSCRQSTIGVPKQLFATGSKRFQTHTQL